MNLVSKYIGRLFLTWRFYLAGAACVILFMLSYFLPILFLPAKILLAIWLFLFIVDYIFLFATGRDPSGVRIVQDRLSNSDENIVIIKIRNNFNFDIHFEVIDELPFQLQERNFKMKRSFHPKEQASFRYVVRPATRGEYDFGDILVFATTKLGFAIRKFRISAKRTVSVYPSFKNLRNNYLLSSATIEGGGHKRIRKIGQSMEFEQIKDYVPGDDIRAINWKATARKAGIMVNSYIDERSQQVYCIIDKGRSMKMPFAGLSLLDYSINACLALTNLCLKKQDKVGMISFAQKIGTMIPADRLPVQRDKIMKALFKEQTAYLEPDYESLYLQIRQKIKQRSLLVLFTNFESLNGLQRQINYLRSIARHHLLLVVFFENTELEKISYAQADTLEDVYTRTIAEKYVHEKKLIVRELQKYGISSILSSPANLTVATLNRYLQLKSQQVV